MRHLNYNHLMYFWTVAREGTIARAAETLFLTPQTISGQLKLLEQAVGSPLFKRSGRRLVLTETGKLVRQYADEIFALGAELAQRVSGGGTDAPRTLNVGVVDSIAKLIACEVLEPALTEDAGIVCTEGGLDHLLAELAVLRLDLVISDRPLPPGLKVRAYNHALGGSGVSFFARPVLARRYAREFPHSLDGAPMLLPRGSSALRRRLDDWLDARGITPRVVAEFDDSALLKAFGAAGAGVFPAPTAIAERVEAMYGARSIGGAEGLGERYYAISPERRITHPAVLRITEAAARRLGTSMLEV
ncbi:MAG: transcriptional activator NhaR [Gammaproteobacteria bacterium]